MQFRQILFGGSLHRVFNSGCHVIEFVFAQSPTDDKVFILLRQVLVFDVWAYYAVFADAECGCRGEVGQNCFLR